MSEQKGILIDVKSIVENKKIFLKKKVNELKRNGIVPKLAVILANDLDASKIYVRKKREMCSELGVEEIEYMLDKDTTTEKVLDIINRLNEDDSVHGILVQLPVFKHLDERKILESISPKKDIDGFHPLNIGKLLMGKPEIVACTPRGIMSIIESTGVDLTSKTAVVVGRSIIVGKPVSALLLNKNATVITCHSKTKNLKKYTKMADVLVVAAGVPHLITSDMVKKNAIVIDVGINRIDGKIIGDVDTENVLDVAKYVTPVPGGVGITTVISLLENLIDMASK
ncbi:MAG: bifunctional 5,10-methylenetetrahydrofolate dehydrogenase/5,10-methenyltetrahydrofolate cyclohydrolase [Christensenellales bacterium]